MTIQEVYSLVVGLLVLGPTTSHFNMEQHTLLERDHTRNMIYGVTLIVTCTTKKLDLDPILRQELLSLLVLQQEQMHFKTTCSGLSLTLIFMRSSHIDRPSGGKDS